jgi:cyclophilin family peptidyl-prolyl cis-trans isomerase
MGTDKRSRQRANRMARIEQAEAARRQAATRKRALTIGVAVAVLVAIVGIALVLGGDDDDAQETATGDAAPCAPISGELPEGAPAFAMPTEPPGDELEVTDLVVGEGEAVPAGATVTVHYVGVACSTGVIFDESYSRGEPATFGLDGVIRGWTEGIPGMQAGGQRLLTIPGSMAYGEAGSPPDIGPNETLVFLVELVSFEGGDAATDTTEAAAVSVPPAPGAGAAVEGETPCPAADGSSERTTTFAQAPPDCLEEGASYTAVFETSAGTVRVALDAEAMPSTVNNFVVLARYHYYDGTALFRTDPSIDIIQGGAPTTNSPSDPGPGYTIPDEGGEFTFDEATGQSTGPFSYRPGQLIMARSGGPDASGAQFFFSAGENVTNLDAQGTYLLFGEVTEGLDVLESVLASHRDDPTSQLGGGPDPAVTVDRVTIEQS